MAFLNRSAVESLGFASVGQNVSISDRASFYNCSRISIGSDVRIDDFCVLSAGEGGIAIGNYIHVAVYSSLIGAETITLGDFCNLSSRVTVYSSSDDFSGMWMTNPTVPPEFTGVTSADVLIGRHVIIGSGTVVLPGAVIEEGVAIGALSLVKGRCGRFGMYCGAPIRRIGDRKQDLLEKEQKFLASLHGLPERQT